MLFAQKKSNAPLDSAEISDYHHEEDLTKDDIPLVHIDISLPQVGGDIPQGAARRINSYYRQTGERIRRHAKEQLLREAEQQALQRERTGQSLFPPYQVKVTYTVTFNGKGLLSLYYEVYQYAGGAHGDTLRYGDTWSLADGFPYPLPLPPRRKAIAQIEQQADRQEAAAPGSFFPGYHAAIRRYYDPANSYLTDRGMAVFYPLYTIAPYVAGIQVFIL